MITFPINHSVVLTAVVKAFEKATGLICLLEEQQDQDIRRPALPYISLKATTPGAKSGDDSLEHVSGTVFNRGGVRIMTVSFHVYGRDQGEAYSFMGLWQASLEQYLTQSALRTAGVSVMVIGNIADVSQLLQTGYEARAQMDVKFGVAANLTEDVGAIEHATGTGTVTGDDGDPEETNFSV